MPVKLTALEKACVIHWLNSDERDQINACPFHANGREIRCKSVNRVCFSWFPPSREALVSRNGICPCYQTEFDEVVKIAKRMIKK